MQDMHYSAARDEMKCNNDGALARKGIRWQPATLLVASYAYVYAVARNARLVRRRWVFSFVNAHADDGLPGGRKQESGTISRYA